MKAVAYAVPSNSRDGLFHTVNKYPKGWWCDCEYFMYRGWRLGTCRHIKFIQRLLEGVSND